MIRKALYIFVAVVASMLVLAQSALCIEAKMDRFIGADGIWKTDGGSYYVNRMARKEHDKTDGAQLFVEVKLSADGNSFTRSNTAKLKDRDIALLPVIDNGTIKKEISNFMPGMKPDDVGLFFYEIGELTELTRKKLRLDKIVAGSCLWVDDAGDTFRIEIETKGGHSSYVARQVLPGR